MGIFNILEMEFYCPKCQHTSKTEVEFKVGFLNLDRYKIGDKLIWGDDFMRKTRIEGRRCCRDHVERRFRRDSREDSGCFESGKVKCSM